MSQPETSQKAICDLIDTLMSQMTKLLNELKAQGLVNEDVTLEEFIKRYKGKSISR